MTDVICDLDGVLYKGNTPVPGSREAVEKLLARGARILYVTNNSTRSRTAAAEHIASTIGVPTLPEQVITSSQAAAWMLGPSDHPTLPVGEEGVRAALAEAGIPTTSDPRNARSVVVGLVWELSYDTIADAAEAVRAGARFVATNIDPTYPTATRLLPGAGSVVAAIATAAERKPEVAGKPNPPIRELLKERGLRSPWVIGDRLDTDIALADSEDGWTSVLVLTGVTSQDDGEGQADYMVPDLAAAVELVVASMAAQ